MTDALLQATEDIRQLSARIALAADQADALPVLLLAGALVELEQVRAGLARLAERLEAAQAGRPTP